MKLVLPLPISPNAAPTNGLHRHGHKRRYQKTVWVAAVMQHKPSIDPPVAVVVSAEFFVHSLRDEDNLKASLKDLLDALRQKQTGNIDWRQGLYDQCGYFIDDNPAHMTLGSVTQQVDRKNKRVEVTIE